MPDRRNLAASLLVPLFALAPAFPVVAADDWVASQVRGTVFSLIDKKWHEVATGDNVPGGRVLRTLQSGRLQLDAAGVHLALGTNTAIQLQAGAVVQFAGSLTVETGAPLIVMANAVVATVNGTMTLVLINGEISIEVASGTVTVADASHGQTVKLVAGQSIEASQAGIELASQTAPGIAVATQASANAGANSNAGGNSANSNAGGNSNGNGNSENSNAGGNSGSGNNSGGNGGGNSGGNSGGNGNSAGNSGESGNSGDNGNGNSGGGGGGNGNGNDNGNGNGN